MSDPKIRVLVAKPGLAGHYRGANGICRALRSAGLDRCAQGQLFNSSMPVPNLATLRRQLERTIGPTPWYWKTFPAFRSLRGQRFVWTHHGDQGPLAYLIPLALEQEPDRPRLALNTYCRPFLVPPHHLGIWCPEGRSIRVKRFDLDQLTSFSLSEIAGWFKQSPDRI